MTDLVDEILTAKGMRGRGGVLAKSAEGARGRGGEGERGRGKRRKMIPNRASNPLAWVPEK